jgi:hypothetical protein
MAAVAESERKVGRRHTLALEVEGFHSSFQTVLTVTRVDDGTAEESCE